MFVCSLRRKLVHVDGSFSTITPACTSCLRVAHPLFVFSSKTVGIAVKKHVSIALTNAESRDTTAGIQTRSERRPKYHRTIPISATISGYQMDTAMTTTTWKNAFSTAEIVSHREDGREMDASSVRFMSSSAYLCCSVSKRGGEACTNTDIPLHVLPPSSPGCVDSCVDAKYTCGVTYRDQCDPQSSDCNLRFICLDPVYKTPAPTPTLFNRTCPVEDIGNGRCDDEYNNEFCLFDGGDCCAPSCLGGSCGAYEYDCKDPDTPEYGLECNMDYVGDGECDSVTNSQECQYDGGDCCERTCKDSVYMCGVNFFNCTGPLPYNTATALSILGCSGSWLRYLLTVMVSSVGWEIW